MVHRRNPVPVIAAFSLLALISCGRRERALDSWPEAPVIIISVDTLRADRLPAYGYSGVDTPAIDALRRDSVLFANAYSHVPMTLPSHVSILTGTLPYEHGVRNNLGYSFEAGKQPTIPSTLKAAGYDTGAAVSAYVLRGAVGLAPAFDWYDDVVPVHSDVSVGELARSGAETERVAESWIADRGDEPFFFLFHIFEPHAPYEAPEPFRTRYANAYDGEVAASDDVVGRLVALLKAKGIYDRAVIIFLSDHGEGLGDHGEGEHGVFLYREAIHVPLFVKLPGNARGGTSIDRPVQLIDLFPTITKLVGVRSPDGLKGQPLFDEVTAPRSIYSETLLPRIHFGWSELRSLVNDRYHMIEAPRPELYDIVSDPRETKNVRADQRRTFTALQSELAAHPSDVTAPSNVDPEEAARLAALGYLGSVRSTTDGGTPIDPKDGIADLEAMKQASVIERGGDVRRAIEMYRAIVARNGRFVDAWLRIAAAEERIGENAKAEEAYRKAIDAAPSLASGIALSLGNLLLRMGRYDDAAAHAGLALERSPSAAHLLLARVAFARKDFARAESEARAAMSDRLRKDEAAVVLATALVASNRGGEALALLDATRGARTEPLRDLESTRGDILARMGRVREAEIAFESEIASFPRNHEAYTRLAVLLMTESRFSEAEKALERMFAADPTPATARLAAETWSVVGAREPAERWARRATMRPR